MSKKVLITATVQSHICQFHKPLVKMLHENGYEVHTAARDNLAEKNGLKLDFADKVYDVPFSRSPASKSNIKAYEELKKIMAENDYDIIHCNTPMGGVVTRLAARGLRKSGTKVIYTAHGFHFYKGAPLKNWLFYYPVEWLCSWFTDCIITINTEDYNFAKKHLHASKVEYIHGVGFDSKRFIELSKEDARNELGIDDRVKVILSVGDLCKRKNHSTVIKALKHVDDPNIVLYIAGYDLLDGELSSLTKNLMIENNVVFLGYTRDLSKYFAAADLYIFPSLQEGLPVALMEAMSWGLPVIASDIRGNNDLIVKDKGGILLKPTDVYGFAYSISKMLKNDEYLQSMGNYNKERVKNFEVEPVRKEIERVYKEIEVK